MLRGVRRRGGVEGMGDGPLGPEVEDRPPRWRRLLWIVFWCWAGAHALDDCRAAVVASFHGSEVETPH